MTAMKRAAIVFNATIQSVAGQDPIRRFDTIGAAYGSVRIDIEGEHDFSASITVDPSAVPAIGTPVEVSVSYDFQATDGGPGWEVDRRTDTIMCEGRKYGRVATHEQANTLVWRLRLAMTHGGGDASLQASNDLVAALSSGLAHGLMPPGPE